MGGKCKFVLHTWIIMDNSVLEYKFMCLKLCCHLGCWCSCGYWNTFGFYTENQMWKLSWWEPSKVSPGREQLEWISCTAPFSIAWRGGCVNECMNGNSLNWVTAGWEMPNKDMLKFSLRLKDLQILFNFLKKRKHVFVNSLSLLVILENSSL